MSGLTGHGGVVRDPDAVGSRDPSEVGLVFRMGRRARRLLHIQQREAAAEKAAEPGPEKRSGAYRSAMDAGITGGFSLLGGGTSGRKR